MNPVFMAKLPTSTADNNGRLFELASAPSVDPASVPGALPRTPNRGTVTLAKLQSSQRTSEPAVAANVPMPHPAPQPKQGEVPTEQEKPTSIAGLIGNLFGGSKSEASSAPPPQKEQVTARSTDLAAKPKHAAPAHAASPTVRTASAGSTPWPREAAPKVPADATSPWPAPAPAPPPAPQTAKTDSSRTEPARPAQPEIRTAYSTPPASNNGLLSGAQPVVPVGTFNSFR
jgi:hypothetical protein